MAASDARPVPRKGEAYRVYFPIFDADGDLVFGATGLDSEISIDGGSNTDCTNEAVEIGANFGWYYVDLTTSETNGDAVCGVTKTTTSGAKTAPWSFFPEELGDIRVNVGQISGDATAADNLESFMDGTGYAGTNNVIPLVTTTTTATNVTTVNGLAANVITAAAIASDAITAAKIADGAIDAATFAAGAINAAAIASDAITDAKVASDVTIASVTGAVGSVTGAVGSVTGNVGGNVVGSVASVTAGVTVTTNNDKTGYGLADSAITSAKFAAGAITATVIATDAIDADALAADVTTELQSGLLTTSAFNTKLGTPAGASVSADIAAAKADTAAILDDTGTSGVAVSSVGVAAIWAYVVSGTVTAVKAMRGLSAVLFGKSSGGATTVITFRDADDTKDVIVATVDTDGNRTTVVRDLT